MEAPKDKDGMKRSMRKEIDGYNELRNKKGGNFGAFYNSDLDELRKIAFDKSGTSFREVVLIAVWNGLRAGFMIGYRAGLREARKNAKG